MKKYLTTALFLLCVAMSISAQNPRTDTSMVLSVYNTGKCFKMEAADFGGAVTATLVGTMVRSYDTVMVLKENGQRDTTGRKPLRYKVERPCDKMSQGLKDKIVVMELNKDCDVTQTCLNVQRAGAKAFVIIHNSNSQGNIKLPKRGAFKDSIRIPIFTVRNVLGDSITALLPTVVGIRKPVIPPVRPNQLVASTNNGTTANEAKDAVKMAENDADTEGSSEKANSFLQPTANSFSNTKVKFGISPNPTNDQTTLTYQFSKATDATITVETASGQVVLSQQLKGVTVGSLDISTLEWANGTYILSLQSGKDIKTKKFVVQH
jgi:hypothetical protein